jgi:hypothetical protein
MKTKRALWTAAALCLAAQAAEYSWNQPQAEVDPKGGLSWKPQPYVFTPGETVRYIDFENGNDNNPGTKSEPWKHHPWDENAAGNAAAAEGVDTYVFKGGVIYRGSLSARESGTPEQPIRLCSDPEWGEGKARIWGSMRLTGGWQQGSAETVPGVDEPEKVWFQDIGTEVAPKAMWRLDGGQVTRIPIAREPDWEIDHPYDIHTQWYVWEDYDGEVLRGTRRGPGYAIDSQHLTQVDPDYYDGAIVWTEKFCPPFGNMNTDSMAEILDYDPKRHGFKLKAGINIDQVQKGHRYFIENALALMDQPGEFFFSENYRRGDGPEDAFYMPAPRAVKNPGRLYVRLPGDQNPNGAVIEISVRRWPVQIINQSHIAVEGIEFQFDNCFVWGASWPMHIYKPTVVRVIGDCRNIRIAHCDFYNVSSALTAFPRLKKPEMELRMPQLALDWKEDFMDGIEFCDNDVAHSDRGAVEILEGYTGKELDGLPFGRLGHVRVMRNRFSDIAFRQGPSKFALAPAIDVLYAETAEIAGNIISNCLSAGIDVRGGKRGGDLTDRPLRRYLIYNNSVEHVMLGQNDYGGIETWQGGPFYIYNNKSGDAIGYKNNRFSEGSNPLADIWLTQSPAYYLDGSYKNYCFNNIAWGHDGSMTNAYRTRMAFNMVMGFMNHWFNNTAYDFMYGFSGSPGDRNSFLANVLENMHQTALDLGRKDDLTVLGGGEGAAAGARFINRNAVGFNLCSGPLNDHIIAMRDIKGGSISEIERAFNDIPIKFSHPGWKVEAALRDPEDHDFRLQQGTPAEDAGVKFFVPWALYKTVGEWNFYRDRTDPERVLGEAFNMTDEYAHRDMYYDVPVLSLHVPGATLDDYTDGPLEDWTVGALTFDGKERFGVVADADMKSDYPRKGEVNTDNKGETKYVTWGKIQSTYPGEKRETLDMDTNSFLIEAVLKGFGGTIVSKHDGTGYALALNSKGLPELTLSSLRLCADQSVTDGQWHHLLVEVDRGAQTVVFYVDGKPAGQADIKKLDDASLSNTADFYVGKGPDGDFFRGALDFLRISRGTLADAKTTIEELYEWEFNGPFLRDFTGRKPAGEKRDAGALEL